MDESGSARGFAKIVGQKDTIARFKAFADMYLKNGNPVGHVLP